MERPESRITLRVWKIPENPPKATAPVTGSRHLEAGKVWQRLLTPVVIDEMACTGSVLVIALGLNMLKITNVKLANLILAPFVPILLYQIAG